MRYAVPGLQRFRIRYAVTGTISIQRLRMPLPPRMLVWNEITYFVQIKYICRLFSIRLIK